MVMDKIKDKKGNKGYAYALVTNDTLDGWEKAFPKSTEKPKNITSDSGSEFKGVFGKYLSQNDINHRVVEIGDHRTMGIVDRVIRTIRDKLRILWEVNDNFLLSSVSITIQSILQ